MPTTTMMTTPTKKTTNKSSPTRTRWHGSKEGIEWSGEEGKCNKRKKEKKHTQQSNIKREREGWWRQQQRLLGERWWWWGRDKDDGKRQCQIGNYHRVFHQIDVIKSLFNLLPLNSFIGCTEFLLRFYSRHFYEPPPAPGPWCPPLHSPLDPLGVRAMPPYFRGIFLKCMGKSLCSSCLRRC